MPPAVQRPAVRLRRLGIWLAFWIGLFVLTHIRVVPGGRFHFDFADKIAHVVLYLLLTWLGGRYLASRGALRASTVLIWMGIYAAYGVFDEWLQQFVGRQMALADWLADLLGITLATLWLLWTAWRAKLSEPPPAGVTPP